MTNKTKIQLLVALLIIWGGTLVLQYSDETESSDTSVNNSTSIGSILGSTSHALTLSKSFTNPRQNIALSTPRNIFSSFNRRSTTPSSKKAMPSKKIAVKPVEAKPVFTPPSGPSPEELAYQQAQQQLRQFRFLGYLKKGGESQAFLTKGQSIYIVKQGATVEGRIFVNRIDPTLVILSTQVLASGDHVKAEIPLTKDHPNS